MANNQESFDSRVERFLKNQMSPEEEALFLEELHSDKDKLNRAQTIALAIKEMQNGKNSDSEIVEEMSAMNETEFKQYVVENNGEEFDLIVERFLKGQMEQSEEVAFKAALESSLELRERAQTIALTIERMRSEGRQSDKEMIQAIKEADLKALKKLIGIVPGINWGKVISIAASILLVIGVGLGVNTRQNQINNLKNYVDYTTISRSHSSDNDKLQDWSNALQTDTVSQETIDLVKKDEVFYRENSAIIDWNLAVYYLKNGNTKDAKFYLNKLINEHEGEVIAEKAEDVLLRMNKIWFY